MPALSEAWLGDGPGQAQHHSGFLTDGRGGLPPRKGSPPGPPPHLLSYGGSRHPGNGGSAGSGHSNAGIPKSLTPFSSPAAAWLRLQEGRARGPATNTPSLEKLSRGPSTIVHLAGVQPPQHTGDLVAWPHSEPEVPLKGALSLQAERQVAEDGPALCPHLCPHPPTSPPAAETQTHTPHSPSPCSPSP